MDFIFKNVHGLFRTCPLLPGALTAGSAPRLLRPSPPCFVLPSHTGKSPWFPGNLLPQQSVHTFRERGALARPALRWAQLPVPRLTLQRTEFHTVLGGPQTPRIQHRARAPSPHFRPPRSAPASVTLHPDGWAVCAGAPQPRPLDVARPLRRRGVSARVLKATSERRRARWGLPAQVSRAGRGAARRAGAGPSGVRCPRPCRWPRCPRAEGGGRGTAGRAGRSPGRTRARGRLRSSPAQVGSCPLVPPPSPVSCALKRWFSWKAVSPGPGQRCGHLCVLRMRVFVFTVVQVLGVSLGPNRPSDVDIHQ